MKKYPANYWGAFLPLENKKLTGLHVGPDGQSPHEHANGESPHDTMVPFIDSISSGI